ncbi:MAG: TetR/AcrR family transcriptional regulator [Chloroflexi bacterium]|nr:TetR/AcrR family transcriptional regulator [Chloroflexota bacterium]
MAVKAAALFVKNGYLKTTIRDIARECGVSIGALYYYIRSKDDILSLFQEITSAGLQRFTEKRLSALYEMSPRDAIGCAIDDLISFVDATQDITVFWYQEARNLKPEQRSVLFQSEEFQVDLLKKILQWGCDRGEFNITDVDLAAHDIMVLCDMWAFRRWYLRKHYTLEQYKQAQKSLLLARLTGD